MRQAWTEHYCRPNWTHLWLWCALIGCWVGPGQQVAAQPLPSRCPEGCTAHGTCNEELGRCDCRPTFTGPSCNDRIAAPFAFCTRHGLPLAGCVGDELVAPCLNSCNLRGRCLAGFCVCSPGFYGADCSLSLDATAKPLLLAGQGYTLRQRGPRIYIYELPPSIIWSNFFRCDRPLHLLLWQRMLSAGVRTADGDQADFYYIPIDTKRSNSVFIDAIAYVRSTWPWWNRTMGHRHLIVHTGDLGINELQNRTFFKADVEAVGAENVTWLTHWGLYRNHPIAGWTAAHRPGHDIVLPVLMPTNSTLKMTALHPQAPLALRTAAKTTTLFFAGRMCGRGSNNQGPPGPDGNCGIKGAAYSAGTRQKAFYHHHNRSGYIFTPHAGDALPAFLTSSTYCLAPTGGGHGKRQIVVAAYGCVPVTVTDGLLQPFEPELDWSAFSIALPEADIPRLHQLLAAVPLERIKSMQAALHCATQHMLYSSSLGSVVGDEGRFDAFETLMAILLMRLEHPGVPPQQYRAVDPDFSRFANCLPPAGEARPSRVDTASSLCYHNTWPDISGRACNTTCRLARTYHTQANWLGWIGGAVCCAESRAARCPRAWA